MRRGLTGRGAVGRAVVEDTKAPTLQGFVRERVEPAATLCTDEAHAYVGLGADYAHKAVVRRSVSEYVRGRAHVNGAESFWAQLERGYVGTFHKFSEKLLGPLRRRVLGPP